MTVEEAQTVKSRILDEAAHLFVNGGYNGIAMREIAEATGITKPALYYHFKDKDDLILAMLVGCLEEYLLLLETCLEAAASTRERLKGVIDSIFLLTPEKRSMIHMAEQEITHLSQQSREKFNCLYHEHFLNKIKQIFEEGIARREVRPMDARLLTHIFLGMVFPFIQHPVENPRLISDLTLSIFFDGVSEHD